MLTKEGLRYRFRKQMQDVIPIEELTHWFNIMTASMLPSDGVIPLDDRPAEYIELIARGGVNL
jgi:hypothetical protein